MESSELKFRNCNDKVNHFSGEDIHTLACHLQTIWVQIRTEILSVLTGIQTD